MMNSPDINESKTNLKIKAFEGAIEYSSDWIIYD